MSLSLLKSADKIALDPVVALIGPEAYIREHLRENLIQRALAGALKEMNYARFQVGDDDIRRVVEACQDYPCFAAKRVVVLRDAGALKAKDAEVLSAYLDSPQPTTLLLIDDEKLDGRLEWVKKLKKKARIVEIVAPDKGELEGWVAECLKSEGKKAAPEVVECLVDWVGASLEALRLAVSQCCLYIGDAPTLTLKDLEALLVKVTDENVFEMIDALFAKNHVELHRSLGLLLESGEEPLKILSLIHRHLSILLTLKFSGLRKAGAVFRMPPYIWKKYEQQAQRYGRRLNLSLWAPIARADLRLKGSGLPRPLLLKRCVDEIIGLLA
ncbi:MAG: DNA polymerase III subunit delta [Deltaproteobacteria bacterium]|nr:DNA polymerase III subunit delta [Deltaproteobacteria bacterium]